MRTQNIIFEDESIIVCLKPYGLISQSDSYGRENMVSLLENHCDSQIYPLHRLDREVEGIMVYAKTKVAAAALSRDIAENNFKKRYIALVHGRPSEDCGKMQDLLFKDSKKNKSFVVDRERRGVKKASLEYKVLKTVEIENETFSLLEILLHTGRTHQIRVQFSSRGMPLVADKKYGARDNFVQIGLWSYSLEFNHPLTKESLLFSKLPDNFMAKYL